MSGLSRKNRIRRKQGGGGRTPLLLAALLLLLFAGIYLLYSRTGPRPSPPATPQQTALQPLPLPPAPVDRPAMVFPTQTTHTAKAPHLPRTGPARHGEPRVSGRGLLAVIVDDMGSSLSDARALAAIGVPLTFSVIPGLRHSAAVADYAGSRGIELMIHIPMQSKGWPERRLEANGLLVSMSEAEISARIEEFVREIPKAAGANNHTGSEFTEHADKMRPVLRSLKSRGMFYVDSVTTPRTVGVRVARELGVRSAGRDVFLDNEQNQGYIRGQLLLAARTARRKGGAIAICHPHPATVQALAVTLPELALQGITFVPASRLVR